MEQTKRKLKWWQILCIVLASIIGFVGLVLLGARAYFRLSVLGYYQNSEESFIIPDCNTNFIAQGLCYDSRSDSFMATGYTTNKAASPIYVIKNGTRNEFKKLLLTNPDGSKHTGHAGGMAVNGDFVYVAYGNGINVYSYAEVMSAENNSQITCLGHYNCKISDDDKVSVSCMATTADALYIAEFYRAVDYPTIESHKMTTAAGDYNQALMVKIPFDNAAQYGLAAQPTAAYSLPDQVQGVCFEGDKVFFSTSYGAAFSHILCYDATSTAKVKDMTVLGVELPVYAFDSSNLLKDTLIAPMSEEIVIVDNKMYVMCESASNKYIFGKFTSAENCYATKLEYLLP